MCIHMYIWGPKITGPSEGFYRKDASVSVVFWDSLLLQYIQAMLLRSFWVSNAELTADCLLAGMQ